MSEKYIPLYRKYRPKNLQEVVGQEHVKHALTNAINLNKISHAYLFTGPRGTGKTSIARILAKSLNCKEGPTLTPCEVCPSCIDIKNSTPMDVIEIDAASNRKVEDARNILEKIQYVPTNGKFKIYIIDEVHMLTKEAFNTLLKTLEEPPENVIFILATTEPHKVLETIVSRCQRFDFRRITTDDIVNHLKNIAKAEKIKIDDDALFTIAKNAAGGMRDSLALLDQVSVLDSAKKITSEDVNKLLGRLSFDMLNKLSDCIIQSKPQDAIELLEKIYNSGNEPTQILTNFLGYLKNLLIVKNCSDEKLLLDLTQLNNTQVDVLKKQVEKVETYQITFLIEKTVYYIKELKTNTNQHLWLEVAIIDLANLTENTSLLALQERIARLESGISSSTATVAPKIIIEEKVKKEKSETVIKNEMQNAKSDVGNTLPAENQAPSNSVVSQGLPDSTGQEEIKEETSNSSHLPPLISHSSENGWLALLQAISSPPTVSLLSEHARPLEFSDEKIVIGCEKEVFVKMLNSESKKKAIVEAAKKVFNKNVNVNIKLASAQEISEAEKKNPIIEPPAKKEVLKQTIKEEISDDDDFVEHELTKKKDQEYIPSDQVNMVMKLFDGKYID